MTPSDAVERYLLTGEHDPDFPAWPGRASSRRRQGGGVLRRVLVRVVEHRARRSPMRLRSPDLPEHPAEIVGGRIHGMLHGLLPADEATHLGALLPHRVEAVTLASFGAQIERVSLETAWRLANLLLDDLGAPPLSDDTPTLDGVCAHGRAWVTARAFAPPGPFSDVLVHEVAHLLHDLTRGEVGLAPADEAVVTVSPCARETFAYAAEVWSCVSGALPDLSARREQIVAYLAEHIPVDFRVDPVCLGEALFAAADDPICGWRHLRATTAPRSRRGEGQAAVGAQ